VRQLILSPRWILWHLLTLGAMVTCGWLAAWQWQRAGSAMGSALNVGYGLQWPLFAIFFAGMWWRLLRMEAAKLRDAAASDPVPDSPPDTVADTAEPQAEPATVSRQAAAPDGPSPFGPRPASVKLARVTDEEDPELAAYNRMLAALAARDD
jgi:DNA-binding transcriptional regulator of glucitol operon